jgi:6-pyruvoyltetrahydropterin/6-carboxytetrahydropterin synthase
MSMHESGKHAVRMRKAMHVFSAGHFITLSDDLCEPIHGHNWTVAAEVDGPTDAHGMVVDFLLLRDRLSAIVAELDHRMLLPAENPRIEVASTGGEVTARFAGRRWVFPADECVILPMVNTTAELLAGWIGRRLLAVLAAEGRPLAGTLRLEVDECLGQAGVCELP